MLGRIGAVMAMSAICLACSQQPSLSDHDAVAVIDFLEGGHVEELADSIVVWCMAESGFTLEPSAVALVNQELQTKRELLGSKEFAEMYGYGVATQLESNLEAQAIDGSPSRAGAEDDREAYFEALYGAEPSTSQASLSGREGCVGEARTSMEAAYTVQSLMIDLRNDVTSDPRFVSSEQDFSFCMAERGFEEAVRLGWGRSWAASETLALLETAEVHLDDGRTVGVQRLVPEDVIERFDVDPARLESLIAQEQEIAAADVSCESEIADALAEIELDYKRGFAEERNPELNELYELMVELEVGLDGEGGADS